MWDFMVQQQQSATASAAAQGSGQVMDTVPPCLFLLVLDVELQSEYQPSESNVLSLVASHDGDDPLSVRSGSSGGIATLMVEVELEPVVSVAASSSTMYAVISQAARYLQLPLEAHSPVQPASAFFFNTATLLNTHTQPLPLVSAFLTEVQSSWTRPASAPCTVKKASAVSALTGARAEGLIDFPLVDSAFADMVTDGRTCQGPLVPEQTMSAH
ncbi:UNVERIFIED_CONTAM: hypothetical protein FKN15_008520 [Acipenser sinensis]